MGAAARRKGASGERAVSKELEELTGIKTVRDLEQVRSGGSDLLGLTGFILEVKSYKSFAVTAHLEQAAKVCKPGDIPVALLNPNRKKTMCLMYIDDFAKLLMAYLATQNNAPTT